MLFDLYDLQQGTKKRRRHFISNMKQNSITGWNLAQLTHFTEWNTCCLLSHLLILGKSRRFVLLRLEGPSPAYPRNSYTGSGSLKTFFCLPGRTPEVSRAPQGKHRKSGLSRLLRCVTRISEACLSKQRNSGFSHSQRHASEVLGLYLSKQEKPHRHSKYLIGSVLHGNSWGEQDRPLMSLEHLLQMAEEYTQFLAAGALLPWSKQTSVAKQ